MNVRCWNCGQEIDVIEDAARTQERRRVVAALQREADISGTCGDIYRHNALMSAISIVEHL